jgi:hypothetical protein
MDVCFDDCVSGIGLCDGLIIRPEESYRLCCVIVCDLETSKTEEAKTRKWVVKSRIQYKYSARNNRRIKRQYIITLQITVKR